MPERAKFEPKERSNSPAIMSRVAPRARMPISVETLAMEENVAMEKKLSPRREKIMINKMRPHKTPVSLVLMSFAIMLTDTFFNELSKLANIFLSDNGDTGIEMGGSQIET